MIILSIDIGVKNLGLSIINYNDNKCDIKCIKEEIKNISFIILEELYNKYNLCIIDSIIVEQQMKGYKNIYYFGFIISYFQSKYKHVYIVKPYTFNMKIKSYRKRKNVTSEILRKLLYDNNVNTKYNKCDDIADAMCIGLKWLNIDINNIIINSIQVI